MTKTVIDAKGLHYKELNHLIHKLVEHGERELKVVNVNGHRYIGCGLTGDIGLEIEGTAGNDLAAYLNGPTIRVAGNVQDCVCNTMNDGTVVVSGRAGDILGYGTMGGEIYIRGDAGSRCGIHLKGSDKHFPVMVIGGTTGDFLGEYMAGGIIIVLNLDGERRITGRHPGTGMHGGMIFLRTGALHDMPGTGSVLSVPNGAERGLLNHYVKKFALNFGLDYETLVNSEFIKLAPLGSRPYGSMYCGV